MSAASMMELERSNPYVGFRPFLTADALYFFGRDAQTSALLKCLQQHRFVSVVGNSGSGKSSLVLAGVIPTLLGGFLVSQRDQWLIASMRPGDSPLENLAQAFLETLGAQVVGMTREQFADDMRARGVPAVDEVLARRDARANLLLLADQFEELFAFQAAAGSELTDIAGRAVAHDVIEERIRRQSDSQTFVSILMAMAAKPGDSVYVVTTMRTDFMGDCDRFAGLPELINSAGYLVPRLTRQDLRDAIEGPARLKRVRVTPRLCDFVLNEVGDKPDLLPILQHALHRTWEARSEAGDTGPLDLVHLEKVGGLRRALSDEAEALIAGYDERMVATVFRRLTRIDSGRRRVRRACKLSELLAVTGVPREQLLPLLDKLSAEGTNLLFKARGREDNDPRYDISHESLIRQWDRLQRWIDDERELAKFYAELCEKAARLRDTGELSESSMAARRELRKDVSSRHLSEDWAARYAGEVPATWREVQSYLLQSRRNQRKWLFAWSGMAMAVVLLVAALVLRQRQETQWSAKQAEIDAIVKLSESDPTYGVWLASNWSRERFADPAFMGALDNLEQRYSAVAEFTNVATFEPLGDGETVAVALRDGRVHLVQSDGRGVPFATLEVDADDGVQQLVALADSTLLVSTYAGRLIHWHYRKSESRAHDLGELSVTKLARLGDSVRAIVGGQGGSVHVFENDVLRALPVKMSILAANPTTPALVAGYRELSKADGRGRINGRIVQYDIDRLQELSSWPAPSLFISSAVAGYASDGASLLIALNSESDSLIQLSATGRLLWSQKSPTLVRSIAGTRYDNHFWISDFNGDVKQVGQDVAEGASPIARHQSAATMASVPGTEWVVSADDDGDARVSWTDMLQGAISVPMRGHSAGPGFDVRATAVHIFTLDGNGLLRVWSVGRLIRQFESMRVPDGVNEFSALATGTNAMFQSNDSGGLTLYGRPLVVPNDTGSVSRPLALADNGAYAAACLEAGGCWIWTFAGDSIARSVPIELPDMSPSDTAAFSVRAASLFVKRGVDSLFEVSSRTGKPVHRFAIDSGADWRLSPDGRVLAFLQGGSVVSVQLSDSTRTVQPVDSSPYFGWKWGSAGARLIMVIGDTLRMHSWDSSGTRSARTLIVSASDSLMDFDVDADARWLAVLRGERSVSVYAIESGDSLVRVLRLPRPRVALHSLQFLPWGQGLFGTNKSSGAELWEWRPRGLLEDPSGRPAWRASLGRLLRGGGAGDERTLNDRYVVIQRGLSPHPSITAAGYNPPPFTALNPANRQVTLLAPMEFFGSRSATWLLGGVDRETLFRSRRAYCLDLSAINGTAGAAAGFPEGCAARLFDRVPATQVKPAPVPPTRRE